MKRLMEVCEPNGKAKLTNTQRRALEYIFSNGKKLSEDELTEAIIVKIAGFRNNQRSKVTKGERCYRFVCDRALHLFNEFLKYKLGDRKETNFCRAIDKAKRQGKISLQEANALHNIREARNRMTHDRMPSLESEKLKDEWGNPPLIEFETEDLKQLIEMFKQQTLASPESDSEESSSEESSSEKKRRGSSTHSRSPYSFFPVTDSSDSESSDQYTDYSDDSNSASSNYSTTSSSY